MDILSEIKSLYAALPEIGCTQCGACCVSPACTLPEFIYVMDFCVKNIDDRRLARFLLASPRIHGGHEGNLHCIFLDNGRCLIHPGRAGACRLFGIPALDNMGIADMVSCAHKVTVVSGRGDEAFVRQWLDRLVGLNKKLYAFNAEPYFVRGFNLECWLDVYFDPLLSMEVFSDLKNILRENIDLRQFEAAYTPKTGLKEKVDKISILNAMVNIAEPSVVRELLLSIRNDYPFTGTYFFEEANTLLKSLDQGSQP
jgi:hypothetical protein